MYGQKDGKQDLVIQLQNMLGTACLKGKPELKHKVTQFKVARFLLLLLFLFWGRNTGKKKQIQYLRNKQTNKLWKVKNHLYHNDHMGFALVSSQPLTAD